MNFEWTNFYMEFANELLKYKDNRKELIDKMKLIAYGNFLKSLLIMPKIILMKIDKIL